MRSEKQDFSGMLAGIWIAAGIACFGAALGYGFAGQPFSFWFITPMIVALLATVVIMAPTWRQSTTSSSQEALGKAKNQASDQLGMLLSLMDEDELADFKERLKTRVLDDMSHLSDGETAYDAVSIEALLGEDDQFSA